MEKKIMWKNSRNGISIIIFCIGVLLLGIGAGVSFVEFSNFKFGGKIQAQANELEEKEFVLNWSDATQGEGGKFHYLNWSDRKAEVICDKNLADEKIVFQIKYPKNDYEPIVRMLPKEDLDEELLSYGEKVWVYEVRRTGASDMEKFMRVKNAVLKGLKEKTYYDYDEADDVQCRIYVSEKHYNDIIEHGDVYYE